MFECALCGKKFLEQISYDQHMTSNEHKMKALNLTNGATAPESKCKDMACSLCNVSFDSLEKLMSHALTREHALNVMQSNLNSNGANGSDGVENAAVPSEDEILPGFDDVSKARGLSFSSCDVCGKHFTGPEPYRQHLNSDLHKRNSEFQKNTADVSLNAALTCKTCKVTCSGQIPYMQHMNSEAHRKKLRQLEILKSYLNEADSPPRSAESSVSPNSIFVCEKCNITCSGQIPYMQHMNSEAHRKKLRQLEVLQNYFKEANSSPRSEESNVSPNSIFACEICNVTCSGQIPHMQHVNSEAHKKKLRQQQEAQKYTNVTDSSPRLEESNATASGSTNPWFCTVCDKQCTGAIPYQQHLSGANHHKNERKAEVLRNMLKQHDSLNTNGEEVRNTAESFGNALQSAESNGERDAKKLENSILPSFANGLDTVSTEILENSVKIFTPDEKVDFDKQNGMYAEHAADNVNCNYNPKRNESEVENESKPSRDEVYRNDVSSGAADKIDVDEKIIYRECEICNVKLYSEDDVVRHYESLEHVRNKWGYQRNE